MLGQSMIGGGPTLTLALGVRTALAEEHRGPGLGAAALGLAETVLGLFWLWPAMAGGGGDVS